MRARLIPLTLALVLGCGNGSSFSGAEDAGQLRQGSTQFYLPQRGVPEVLLIVVDDTPDDQGRALRAALATDFREHYDSSRVVAEESCRLPTDPALPSLIRRHAIVVPASAADDAAIHSFADDPNLSWIADARSDGDAARWSDAVAAAIEGAETPQPASYQPLAVAEHWVQLLAREVKPTTERERAVLDALPTRIDVEPFLGGERADQSPKPTSAYALEPVENCMSDGACVAEPRSFSQAPRYFFDVGVVRDCGPRCYDEEPRSDAAGAVECRVLVAASGSAECDASIGWQDTSLGSSALKEWGEGTGSSYSVCEVTQLQGSALESCVTDLDCKDCTPGFCITRVPELVADCSRVAFPWSLRFPTLPASAGALMFEARCNLAP